MIWIQAHLTIDKSRTPLIELLFESLGAVAITLGDAGDEPMLEPGPGETPLWQATRVTGLFEGDTDVDALRSAINQALDTDSSRSLRLEHLKDRDWERAWLDRFRPMRFGRRLWIRPGDQPIKQHDAVIVDLAAATEVRNHSGVHAAPHAARRRGPADRGLAPKAPAHRRHTPGPPAAPPPPASVHASARTGIPPTS